MDERVDESVDERMDRRLGWRQRNRVKRKGDGLKVCGVGVGRDGMGDDEDDEGDSRRCTLWNELSMYLESRISNLESRLSNRKD